MSRDHDFEIYACECAGCGNGGTFEAAPSDWWERKGMSPPNKCRDCRDWIRQQRDAGLEEVACDDCGHSFRFSGKARIAEHIRNGSWEDFVSGFRCRRCQEAPGWHEKETYACQIDGCDGQFEGPSRQYLSLKGWREPYACPECKEIIRREKARGIIQRTCGNDLCGFRWEEKPGTRIHRQVRGDGDSEYCRRCEAEPDRLQLQAYECKCRGCYSGNQFEDRHPSFFRKGTPTICKNCRDWLGEQRAVGPIAVRCEFCGDQCTIEVNERQFYHFKKGSWDDAENSAICARCRKELQSLPGRVRCTLRGGFVKMRSCFLLDSSQVADVRGEIDGMLADAEGRGLQAEPSAYDVPSDRQFYFRLVEKKNGDRRHKNALDHICDSRHAFIDIGLNCADQQLEAAADLAERTDELVVEVHQPGGTVAKYDGVSGLCVILCPCDWSPSGWRILTAYAAVNKARALLGICSFGRRYSAGG